MPTLTIAQEDMLRYLCRQSGAVPEAHLDGRVLRALTSRGLAAAKREWVTPTHAGRTLLAELRQRTRRSGGSARGGRREVLFRAIDALEDAIPLDAEVTLGSDRVYADDVLNGLRRYARRLEPADGDARREPATADEPPPAPGRRRRPSASS